MFSQSFAVFVKRKECYAVRLASCMTNGEPNEKKYNEIFDILCEFLMNPDCTEDVAECFPQLLIALVCMSIPMNKVYPNDGDALHKLNSVVLGKLVRKNSEVLVFVQNYFEINPAPFESIQSDYSPPAKRTKKQKIAYFAEISDYHLVISCYDILCSAPIHFKHVWNWSKFYKYLTHKDQDVRWVAMNCIAIILGMSESCYLSRASNFVSNIQQFFIESKETHQNIVTSKDTTELDKKLNVPSVVSIGGILLPVFSTSKSKVHLNLVPVPSTERNLQNLAFAVSSNKCVCLQGAVGSGKTALVEYLAQSTGRDAKNFVKVQLGDQTDSKMLLGMYRCTDIPGEFLWQPGVLTEAVLSGKWLLLEDIDCAATDVISVIGQLVESKTLSVPGYRDLIHAKSGFQLFVTRRLNPGGVQKSFQMPLQKHWACVTIESLSKQELVTIVQSLFPVLHTVATRIVDVFLLFSVGNHDDDAISNVRNARQISTRDLIKWCSRAVVDFDVSSPISALKIFQDALDVFCYSVPNSVQRLNLATEVAHKLGIVKTKADYFCDVHKPSINIHKECLIVGRAKLGIKKSDRVKLESKRSNFSYTRPSVCLLERIATCVIQKEPVLLVGETGTGKTSCIQYLAQITGHKLIVINMNQQSESTDLLGGYKPVDLKISIQPIREEFEILFRSYFAIEPNLKFLNHLGRTFEERKWKALTILMIHSTTAALKRLKASSKVHEEAKLLKKWQKMAQKLEKLQSQVQSQYSLAFSFMEGSLVKALKNGDWVLLDEINLATAETLECLSGLLEGSCGSLSLLERGDKEPIKRHEAFAIFACMNPATDVGKRDLPVGLRNRFTEFFVDELTEKSDLQFLASSYLNDLNLPPEKIENIVKFYLNVRKEAEARLLDGTGHKPHYSLRTLCRALSVSAQNPCANALRSLYEAFCLSFLTQLDSNSYPLVHRMIVKLILGDAIASAIIKAPIPRPRNGPAECFISFEGYWIPKGDLDPQTPENYVLTETVKQNLKDLVRVVSIGKMPVLLQGDTSVGKTSLITYLARASGHICVRINNHEHTDLQEYVGTYVADSTGKLVFKEGILVDAMRKGYWIILDELNLAPSDVLEALNRVLDDNRELFIPETQQVVKAHDNFMLFATQNPPGLYGGRKVLSRAFRNRFVELHFDEIPPKELQIILHKRCKMPETYCKQVISVMTELQIRRKSTATFAGKKGFITLRDLFRWAERYHLAPDTGGTLYDWSQHLADEGYLVLSSKARRPEECQEIIEVLKKHLKRDVDPDALFSLSERTSTVTRSILESLLSKKIPGFEHVVWTFQMRKMAVLLSKACDFKEPVLLIGETGGGKTTVCQLLSVIREQELSIVNCHMHTEASDFLGSLRPVRDHSETQKLFEWVDGPLVKSMKNGGFFLVDEISLADDSVLERLNSLLEPERKLLIAEKPSTEENATVTAHENFIFVGTMNPGGDYGKKELSPALRNRFTEIWCEGCVSLDDLKCIMAHNLDSEYKESISTAIIEFIKWLQTTEIGKKLVVSVRDVLTWVNFVNCCKNLAIGDAFYHGAALSYIDGLGSGLTAAENSLKLSNFKRSALAFIKQQVNTTLQSTLVLDDSLCLKGFEWTENKFGIQPFYIEKGNKEILCNKKSLCVSATIASNSLKFLRALQLKKPILLEGSPGVGKTTLVCLLAKASGHGLLRLNLSDQTDISDLFGADLPVEGGKPGEFSWRDGPFLRALRNGDWILLDELNLASQSVLEGLNACLDHRGEIYIPELGMTFTVKPGTRLFGCQNPLRQGGGRRGLPKSFLNRFTQVFVNAFDEEDLQIILNTQFSNLPEDLVDKMIKFNQVLSAQVGITWGHSGSPWEMNLRDLIRWCEITIATSKRSLERTYNPGNGAQLIYVDRMRTMEDKNRVIDIYNEIFCDDNWHLPDPEFPIHLTKEKVFFGDEILRRSDSAFYEQDDLLLLREQKAVLRGLAQCVNMNWMAILIGGSGTGKSSLVHLLANLAGQQLKTIVVNSATDTTELLGGFEQTDYNRHLEELLERVEALLTGIVKKNLTEKNLDAIVHFHALLENVRRVSEGDDKTMGTSMSTETKLFLRKTEELSKLVSTMRASGSPCESELREIERKLADLSIAVGRDKCLNAGGKFEWVDSVLVKCLQNGTWLLLDQVNLCSPAILDRLNELLEPNGALRIGERGVDQEGNVFTVKAHENFRLFLTMDPRHGEISRAMRNRGVEISIPTPQQVLPSNPLDVLSLLINCGIRDVNHQKLLLKIHESLYDKQYRLNEMLQVASFTSQQMSKGFTLENSLRNSYRVLCGTFDFRSKREALRKIDEILSENSEQGGCNLCYDLDAITLKMSDLQKNSRLAMVKQQGFLLRSAVEQLNISIDPHRIDFQDLLQHTPIKDPMGFLKLLLLDFYERSSLDDLAIRRMWSSKIFTESVLDEVGRYNECLGEEVQSMEFLFRDKSALDVPLHCIDPSTWSNNLAIALYFRLIMLDCQSQRNAEKRKDVINLEEYSSAVCSKRLSTNLKNEPLILQFVKITEGSEKFINIILRNGKLPINDQNYLALRDEIKWYQRFHKLGVTELIDKSQGTFFDVRVISSSLKVHYKWLVKFFKKLFTFFDKEFFDSKILQEFDSFSNKHLSMLIGVDKLRKIRKRIKKILPIQVAPFPEDAIVFHEKLQFASKKLQITDQDLTDLSRTRLKIISISLAENLAIRKKLIEIYMKNFKNNRARPNREEDSMEIEEIAKDIIELKASEGNTNKIDENFTDIEIWPIYEFFFLLSASYFQSRLCKQYYFNEKVRVMYNKHFSSEIVEDIADEEQSCECPPDEENTNIIYDESVFRKFEEIPTIPAQLLGLMKTLNSGETYVERKITLFPEFIYSFEQFADRSFAVKNSRVLLHWSDGREADEEDNSNILETNFINISTLYKLIFELFLTKSGGKREIINFGNYRNRKKLLQTINAMLWINHRLFDSVTTNNDKTMLEFYLNRYIDLLSIQKVIHSFELNDEQQNDLQNRLLQPMKLLEEIKKKLKLKNDGIERGNAWLILGYLQIFLFHDLGYIDPIRKIVLKSKYARENILELEHLMCIENLQSFVLGTSLPAERTSSRVNRLKMLSTQVRSFENFQAARPTSMFESLKDELENFSKNIGSLESMFKQMNSLNEVGKQLQRGELHKSHREKLQEAAIWKKSLERFTEKLERNFMINFPDLVLPMMYATTTLHHGVSILIHEISNMHFQNSCSDIFCKLLRFPIISLNLEDYINLASLCSSEKFLFIFREQMNSKCIQRNRFTMAMIALKELENFSLAAKSNIALIWEELSKILAKIRIVWEEQEKRREEEMKEKQSLFRTKFEAKEEEEMDFWRMFPGYQQDFEELAEMFPGYQQDFPELQRIPQSVSDKKESFSELISTKDARNIQEIHWNILRNYSDQMNSLKTCEIKSEPNFVEPLAQRFEVLGPLVKAWPENMSSQLICSLSVLIAQKSNIDARGIDRNIYDFYRDPNIPEVEECQPLFDKLCRRISEFLQEWPENPILISIKLIIDRLYSFSINSPLSRFLVGVELLLTKIQQWEENARFDVSLAEFIESFGEKILRWRKLEISRWKDSLEVLEHDLKTDASKWWFFLFNLVDQYIAEDAREGNENISQEKMIESLERFLTESSLIEFDTRLRLINLFYQHINYLEESKRRNELSAIFWNVLLYYSQFQVDVQNQIKTMKEPIAKKLKETIKITRWNDISYWSVRNTAEKTRRTLHKFVKEFQKSVQQNVASYLTVKTNADILRENLRPELKPSNFLIDSMSEIKMQPKRIGSLTRKACNYCEYILVQNKFPNIRQDIEIFIEESMEESKKLRNLEIDKTLTKAKQQAQLKSTLQQKKMALANYFKTLSRLGLSYRLGILTWKNRKHEIRNFLSTPLDLKELRRYEFGRYKNENVEEMLLEQWSDCSKYYYESLIKLNSLNAILNSGKCELEVQNIQRCHGLSVHLMLLAHQQKEVIANFFKHFLPFKIQVTNIMLMMQDVTKAVSTEEKLQTVYVPEQLMLHVAMENFQELLTALQLSIKQIVIFLESCPMESITEGNLLDLNETDSVSVTKENVVSEELINVTKNFLNLVKSTATELNSLVTASRTIEKSGQVFLLHRRHVDFLEASYQKILGMQKDVLQRFENVDSPISKDVCSCLEKIDDSYRSFRSLVPSSKKSSGTNLKCESKLEMLTTQILLVIQSKLKDSQKSSEENNDLEKESSDDFEENLMTEGLIGSLKKVIPDLRLETISRMFGELLNTIYDCDPESGHHCMRLLSQYVPLLEQYTLFLYYYLYEQVAAFRLTCKFLYLQLNVFLDLAKNGFCQPKNLDAPEDEQEGGTAQGGMGLADGEGQKDISEKIESEDQLEETKGPNDEEKTEEEKDIKEEEKGIEMSENFEGHLQDLEREEDEENNEDDDEDIDKEMGETDETAEKLDEEIWKDEDEEENNEDDARENEKEERGTGEKTGKEELSGKDDDEAKNKDEGKEADGERKEEEKKEINEFEEPEVNEDQIDPYHGKHQPEIEPEPFDLPEDVNLDEEMKEDNPEGEQEDPFDIDQMKESKLPEEPEKEESEEKDGPEEDKQPNSSDEEDNDEEDPNADYDKRKDETMNSEEDKKDDADKQDAEEEKQMEEDKAPASLDAGSKEVDASQEVESKKDGSRDAVKSQSNEEQMDTSTTENDTDDKKDNGTGQSQTEERTGHSTAKQEENAPVSGKEKSTPVPTRRKPGQSNENRSLPDDDNLPAPKKLKTAVTQEELDAQEEREKNEGGGDSETYEHIKSTEKFDDYVLDAATEEQIKKQTLNLEEDKEEQTDNKLEDDDVQMHEESETEDRGEETKKEQSEKVSESKKNKSTNARDKKTDDIEQIELGGEVEGEIVETTRVLRGNESTIHTKQLEQEVYDLSMEDIQQKRCEIEKMLGQWSRVPSSVEAANAWNSISTLTESAARELSEKLRLVLEPTLTSHLKGDYRTGRRINMRKVIPYIASEFRKDKIWLRRTKPSKRDYQIVLAIDDSSSMADNHSKELAFESLSLIGKAMTYLEVGQLAVINFGERVNILHPFGESFTEESGARLIQEMKFEQKKTMMSQLLDFAIKMFASHSSSSDNAKLLTILSDGRGIFSEGIDKVTAAVRRAKLLNIFLVFIVVDNPLSKDSILDIRMPVFEGGKLLGIRSYMDSFPFPFYVILRDLDSLPVVLSDALRQWFEIVGRIDT
ncbi:midasin [Xylocopa sonorina]|uniref:midasin n=1 Tax=Xylocopa sonorina TaxID=1818115 RepID=UPI00403B3599